jgi:hypothetical protein
MKSLLLALVLLCAPVVVLAGEISIPGKTCTTNCTSQMVSSPTPLQTQILLSLLSLIF